MQHVPEIISKRVLPGLEKPDFRHNTEVNYSGFQQGFGQLAVNRIFYTLLTVLLVFVTIWIYEKKERGI